MKAAAAFAAGIVVILGSGCGDVAEPADALGEMDADGPARATVRVLTFNVLCSICDFDFDPWEDRVGYIGDIVKRHQPDLAGLQEFILPDEVDQVMALLPEYSAVYYRGTGEYYPYPDAVALYRTDRFELLESGEYWLSPTPDVPWSMGFSDGQDIPRLVVWVHLRDLQEGGEMYFSTTHFDAVHPHQEKSAPLVLEKMAPWADSMPAIITGDFNLEPYHEAFGVLTGGVDGTVFHLLDTWEMAASRRIETNVDQPPEWDQGNRIDHILLSGPVTAVPEWVLDMTMYGPAQQLPSDHKAMSAIVETAR